MIRGVYVNTHLRALRREHGEHAFVELQRRFGKELRFDATELVPVGDEVRILEDIIAITHPGIADDQKRIEAGKLHFRNFSHTTLWRVLKPFVAINLKWVLMRSRAIAGRVFQGVTFVSRDSGENSVVITLLNNDYPVEHFVGFFESLIMYTGYVPEVTAHTVAHGLMYEYLISWRKK